MRTQFIQPESARLGQTPEKKMILRKEDKTIYQEIDRKGYLEIQSSSSILANICTANTHHSSTADRCSPGGHEDWTALGQL